MSINNGGSHIAADSTRITVEQHSQRLVTAFVASGMLFMLLPGTFLGVWNLLGISQQHSAANLGRPPSRGYRGLHRRYGLCDRAANTSTLLWSANLVGTRLMFWSLLLLRIGCGLRVTFEPIANATIATWGMSVYHALEVAHQLGQQGKSIEVVDLRSIVALDEEPI